MTNMLVFSSVLLVFLCYLVQVSYENYSSMLLHHHHSLNLSRYQDKYDQHLNQYPRHLSQYPQQQGVGKSPKKNAVL